MDNSRFDPHAFGAGAVGIAGVAAVAMAMAVREAATNVQDVIADHAGAEHYRDATETIENMLAQNEEMRGIVADQNVVIDDLYAKLAELQVLLLETEQPS